MPFIKVIKTSPYYARYQTKWRRRREGKTDYYARKRLILQDKNKYNTPKYRLVARFTNKDIITQIVSSKINGDYVMAAAYSHELAKYGMPVGLTNYAAAYATGLLLARRTLAKLGLADKYQGNTNVNGEDYNVEPVENGPRPFFALLDVGLARTTTGQKVFAVLKGATDGGIEVPHSEARFVGYDKEGSKLNAEVLRKYIFGGHIKEYMTSVKSEDQAKYDQLFSQYTKNKLDANGLEAAWAKVHKAIRADPTHKSTAKPEPASRKRYGRVKMSLSQRKDRVRQKLATRAKKAEKAE
jgi:large subunit ribosomal protein L5e